MCGITSSFTHITYFSIHIVFIAVYSLCVNSAIDLKKLFHSIEYELLKVPQQEMWLFLHFSSEGV